MGKEWAPEFVQTSDKALWLDDDNAVMFIVDVATDQPCGGILYHRRAVVENGFTYCAAGFYWQQPSTYKRPVINWQLESLDPLTLSPSLLCGCGYHGFIKQGKWIPA